MSWKIFPQIQAHNQKDDLITTIYLFALKIKV